MEIITVSSLKGGVGKTTTVVNLAAAGQKHGKKVLVIDLDPQGSSGVQYAINFGTKPDIVDVLNKKVPINDAIIHTEKGDIIPAPSQSVFGGIKQNPDDLKNALQGLDYDIVIIDVCPVYNDFLENAYRASTQIIIPTTADLTSANCVMTTSSIIQKVQKDNPELVTTAVLRTRWRTRDKLAVTMDNVVLTQWRDAGIRVFDTFIRESVSLRQSGAAATNVFDFAHRSAGSDDYDQLFMEVFENGKQ